MKMTALLTAAVLAVSAMPITNSAVFAADVPASENYVTGGIFEASWLPTTMEQYEKFVAEYGNISVHDDCIVYCGQVNYSTGESVYIQQSGTAEINTIKDYSIKVSSDGTPLPDGSSSYIVQVYQAASAGTVDFTILRGRAWDKNAPREIMHSETYKVDENLNITATVKESDSFEWLPETLDEYETFVEENGMVSVHGRYIVYCDKVCGSLGESVIMDQTGTAEIKGIKRYGIETEDKPDGAAVDMVYVYEAVISGTVEVTISKGILWNPNAEKELKDFGKYEVSEDLTITEVDNTRYGIGVSTPPAKTEYAIGEELDLTGLRLNGSIRKFEDGEELQGCIIDEDYFDLIERGTAISIDSSEFNNQKAGTYNIYVLFGGAKDSFKVTVKEENKNEKIMTVSVVDYDTGELITTNNDKTWAITLEAGFSVEYALTDGTFGWGTEWETLGSWSYGQLNPNKIDVSNILLHGFDVSGYRVKDMYIPDDYFLPEDYLDIKYKDSDKFHSGCADEITVKLKKSLKGDVNGDGSFNIADTVMLQKWLIAEPDVSLTNWKAADLNGDDRINSADLAMMKRELLKQIPILIKPDNVVTNPSSFITYADNLPLRSGPDESYPVVAVVPKRSYLYEIGYMNGIYDWLYTEYNGVKGWLDISSDNVYFDVVAAKPVIYLYPEEETDVHVELELKNAKLATTYPKYNNGWDVTALPDGTIINKADGTHHKYLFWDACDVRTHYDFSKGFCVAGNETEAFLKEKLTYMGLNEQEMNEFIVYWLPKMEHNEYNFITFQSEAYTDNAVLNITPTPDSICRIFMAYVPLDEEAETEPQQLETFERNGFTVVEWGGTEIK